MNKSTKKKIYGKVVNLMRKEDLIAYKNILRRKVDLDDIRRISRSLIYTNLFQ